MNGLGHGYLPFKFRLDTMTCVEAMGKKPPKKAQYQFFDQRFTRVRLPRDPIFGLLASSGSPQHRKIHGIFGQYFLYQSQFWITVPISNECESSLHFDLHFNYVLYSRKRMPNEKVNYLLILHSFWNLIMLRGCV